MIRGDVVKPVFLTVVLSVASVTATHWSAAQAQPDSQGTTNGWEAEQRAGSVAFDRGDYVAARAHWQDALQAAEQAENDAAILDLLDALGRVSTELGDPEAAASCYGRRVRMARAGLGIQDLINLLSSTARRYETLGLNEDALALLFEVRGRVGSAFEGGPLQASADLDLARHFKQRRKYQLAERHYLLAIESLEQPPYHRMIAYALEDYAGLLAELGRDEESEQLLAEARRHQAAADEEAAEAGLVRRVP